MLVRIPDAKYKELRETLQHLLVQRKATHQHILSLIEKLNIFTRVKDQEGLFCAVYITLRYGFQRFIIISELLNQYAKIYTVV